MRFSLRGLWEVLLFDALFDYFVLTLNNFVLHFTKSAFRFWSVLTMDFVCCDEILIVCSMARHLRTYGGIHMQ